jgi:hypothetical protein
VGQHQIDVNGNIVSLGNLSLTVGDSSRATSGGPITYDQTRVFMNGNRVGGNEFLTVGTNALNIQANSNIVSKDMVVNVGTGLGYHSSGGGSAGSEQVSGNTVTGTLSNTVGLPGLTNTGPVAVISAVTMDSDTAGRLFVNVLPAPNNPGNIPETVNITNDTLTIATAATNLILVGVGGASRNTTVSNLKSPLAPVGILVGAVAFNVPDSGVAIADGATVNLNAIVSDQLTAAVGNKWSNVLLTNSTTNPDANGDGSMRLSIGTSNVATGTNVTAAGLNVVSSLLELDKMDTFGDLTIWNVADIAAFDMNMAAGDSPIPQAGTNIATLNNIKVTDFMVLAFGSGFNGVQATNLVVTPGFGWINGGGNPGSIYIGSPTNFGFVVFGFGAYF